MGGGQFEKRERMWLFVDGRIKTILHVSTSCIQRVFKMQKLFCNIVANSALWVADHQPRLSQLLIERKEKPPEGIEPNIFGGMCPGRNHVF